jgi:hypothetical protein
MMEAEFMENSTLTTELHARERMASPRMRRGIVPGNCCLLLGAALVVAKTRGTITLMNPIQKHMNR